MFFLTFRNNKEITKKSTSTKPTSTTTKRKSNIKQFLGKGCLNFEEQKEYDEHFRFQLECPECKKLQVSANKCSHRLNRWAAWQTSCQNFSTISHSTRTKTFCNLMETADVFSDSNKVEEYEMKMKKKKKEFSMTKTATTTLMSKSKNKAKPKIAGKDFRRKMNEGKLQMISEDSSDSDIEFKKDRTPLFSNKELENISRNRKKVNRKGANTVTKMRVRLTKLPKVTKVEINVSDIEDNQIGFCSQQTMPTLFDRCQMKRKRDSLSTFEEQESEDEIQEEKKLKLNVDHSSSNEEGIFPSIFPSDDQGRTTNEFLPISSPVFRKTPCKESKTVVEKETIPEAPLDLDLSSFNFETQPVEKLDGAESNIEKMDGVENTGTKMDEAKNNAEKLEDFENNDKKFDRFENNDGMFEEIESSDEKLMEVEKHLKKLKDNETKDIGLKEVVSNDKKFEAFDDELDLTGDSLMKLFDEADANFFNDLPASPPIVSQLNHQKRQVANSPHHKKKDGNTLFESEENKNKILEENNELVVDDSPIIAKKKKRDIFEDEIELFEKEDEDSPIFTKKKNKNRNAIFETQQTPTRTNRSQIIDNSFHNDQDDDFDDDFVCPEGNQLSLLLYCFDLSVMILFID